jgi:competence protein ComEA
LKPWLLILTGVLIGLLAAGGILVIARPERGIPITLLPAPTLTPSSLPKPTATPMPIQVLIKGQINTPGIYKLDKEARLYDLIELAGGLTEGADIDRVNNVFILRDGDYFYIPSIGENIPDTARNAPGNNPLDDASFFDYPLNLNTATQAELESLPGIGPTKATDIITYRDQEGFFKTVDDLLNIPGIGPSTLDAIREYLIVEP